jgi:hypothetical protein
MTLYQSIKDNAFVLMMIVGVLQFLFTVSITLVLHLSGRRQRQLDVLRSIDGQWQDLNRLIVSDPRVEEAIRDAALDGATPRDAIRRNVLFYVLNTFQQIVRARSSGFLDAGVAEELVRGHIGFLRRFEPELPAVLTGERGFDAAAVAELRRVFESSPPSA